MKKTGLIFNIQKFSINDGPGIRTTVFFKGCPLKCPWCSNPESQNRFRDITDKMEEKTYTGREYTVDEVMEAVRKDIDFYLTSGGGMTLSGGEPLQQLDFAIELCRAAHGEGISVATETTGFAPKENFTHYMENIDILLMDFKHADPEKHLKITGVPNDIIIENLKTAIEMKKEVAVRIPVIPGFNNDKESGEMMAATLSEIGAKTVHFLPFHQFGESKYKKLGVPYKYAGFKQMHPEQLENYIEIYRSNGLDPSFK